MEQLLLSAELAQSKESMDEHMCLCRLIVLLSPFMLCMCVSACTCAYVCTCCSMLAVNCMAWWCCCSSMSMWRSSRKSFLSSSIQPSSSWGAVGRGDASLDVKIWLHSLTQKVLWSALVSYLDITSGSKSDHARCYHQKPCCYWAQTHYDFLITWISGLATSREIFWLLSLVSSATASSRFWISTPLILRNRRNIERPNLFLNEIVCVV